MRSVTGPNFPSSYIEPDLPGSPLTRSASAPELHKRESLHPSPLHKKGRNENLREVYERDGQPLAHHVTRKAGIENLRKQVQREKQEARFRALDEFVSLPLQSLKNLTMTVLMEHPGMRKHAHISGLISCLGDTILTDQIHARKEQLSEQLLNLRDLHQQVGQQKPNHKTSDNEIKAEHETLQQAKETIESSAALNADDHKRYVLQPLLALLKKFDGIHADNQPLARHIILTHFLSALKAPPAEAQQVNAETAAAALEPSPKIQKARAEVLTSLLPSLQSLEQELREVSASASLYKKLSMTPVGEQKMAARFREIEETLHSEHVTASDRAAIFKPVFSEFMDELGQHRHAPVIQKSVLRLMKKELQNPEVSEADRVEVLKKLGTIGKKLNTASIKNIGTNINVQKYACNIFKRELTRLSPAKQAQLAVHWASESLGWSDGMRPLSKRQLRNAGTAAGVAALAGAEAMAISMAGTPGTIQSAIAQAVAVGGGLGAALGLLRSYSGDNRGSHLMTITLGTTPNAWDTQRVRLNELGDNAPPVYYGAGAAASYSAEAIAFRAANALREAGGVAEVWRQLRANPLRSIQADIQQTSAEALSFDTLPVNMTQRAARVQEIAPHLAQWVEASAGFAPENLPKIRDDLGKIFDSNHYNPQDWASVQEVIRPAQEKFRQLHSNEA